MGFFDEILRTFIDIIEEKLEFRLNRVSYFIITLLFFSQIVGYVFFSSDNRVLSEEKIVAISKFFANSTGFFVLSISNYFEPLVIVFYITQSCIYTIFIYLITLTLIRMHTSPPTYLNLMQTHLKPINQCLNICLIFFPWIILIPCMEISSGFLFCSDYTYIMFYQNNCSEYPVEFVVLGLIGLLLTVVLGIAVTLLYRNYEFNESELLKRKYSRTSLVQFLFITSMIVMFWARIGINVVILNTSGFILSLAYSILYEAPFRDRKVMQFFSISGAFFVSGAIISSVWVKIDSFSDELLFYLFLCTTSVLSGAATAFANKRYEDVLCFNPKEFARSYSFLDVHLEELFKLTELQAIDQRAKCSLLKVLLLHRENCSNPRCECNENSFKDEKGLIQTGKVHALIECIFAWSLTQEPLQKNYEEFENISLKYISFLTKYRNNPAKAFYELKVLSTKKQNKGYYFTLIAPILMARIELQLKYTQNLNSTVDYKNKKDATNVLFASGAAGNSPQITSTKLQIERVFIVEKHIEEIAKKIVEYATARASFWSNFLVYQSSQLQQSSMCEILQIVMRIARLGQEVEQRVRISLDSLKSQGDYAVKTSAKILKILCAFRCIIRNEVKTAMSFEQRFQDLLKQDEYSNSKDDQHQLYHHHHNNHHSQLLTNLSIVRGHVALVTISLSQDKGRITNGINNRFLRFFGYEKDDITAIRHVNQLMPSFIAKIHSNLIENYINRGYSLHIDKGFFTFALNKRGYLFPVTIYLNCSQFCSNDYTINAVFVRKNRSVKQSTNDSELEQPGERDGDSQEQNMIVASINGGIEGITEDAFKHIFKRHPKQKQQNNNNFQIPLDNTPSNRNKKTLANIPENLKVKSKNKNASSFSIKNNGQSKNYYSIEEISKFNVFFLVPEIALTLSKQLANNNNNNNNDDDTEQTGSTITTFEKSSSAASSSSGESNYAFESIYKQEMQVILPSSRLSELQARFTSLTNSQLQYQQHQHQEKSSKNNRTPKGETSHKPVNLFSSPNKFTSDEFLSNNENNHTQIPLPSPLPLQQKQQRPSMSNMRRQSMYHSSLFSNNSRFQNKHLSSNHFIGAFCEFYEANKHEWKNSESLSAKVSLDVNRLQYKEAERTQIDEYFIIELNELQSSDIQQQQQLLESHAEQQQQQLNAQTSHRKRQISSTGTLKMEIPDKQSMKQLDSTQQLLTSRTPFTFVNMHENMVEGPSTNTMHSTMEFDLIKNYHPNNHSHLQLQNQLQIDSELSTSRQFFEEKKLADDHHYLSPRITQELFNHEAQMNHIKTVASPYVKINNITAHIQQQKLPNTKPDSSISSRISSKLASEDLIPSIIQRRNPPALLRLKLNAIAVMCAFIALGISIPTLGLPLLREILQTLTDLEPVQALNNAYLQAQLYTLIFTCLKEGSVYPSELVDKYKEEVVNAGAYQMLDYHIDSEEIMRSQIHLGIVWADHFYTVYLFPDKQYEKEQVFFRTQYDLNYDAISQAAKYLHEDTVHLESMMYLSMNLPLIITQARLIFDEIIELLTIKFDAFDFNSHALLYLSIGMYIIMIGWSAYSITMLNTYKLKVLQLITRASFAQASAEAEKFKRVAANLRVAETDEWMHMNFPEVISTASSNSSVLESAGSSTAAGTISGHNNHRATNQNQQNHHQFKQAFNQTNQQNPLVQSPSVASSQKGKPRKDLNIASVIANSNSQLPFLKSESMIVFLLPTLYLCFIIAFILTGHALNDRLTPKISIYEAVALTQTSYNNLACLSELLVSSHKLKAPPLSMPINEIQGKLHEEFLANLNLLQDLSTNFSTNIENYDDVTARNRLEVLLKNDLCVTFPDAVSCAAEEPSADSFSKGMIGFISKVLSFYSEYAVIIKNGGILQNEDQQSKQSDSNSSPIHQYMLDQAHLDLILRDFDVPQESFIESQAVIVENISQEVQSFINFLNAYVLVGLIVLSLIILISTNRFIGREEKHIALVNSALNLIPFARLGDESTRHLLKQLLLIKQ